MSLKLSKNNSPVYDYFSEGDESDPIRLETTLTNTGGSASSAIEIIFLIATTFRYITIELKSINNINGSNILLSLNNVDWVQTLYINELNAISSTQVQQIYIKTLNRNDNFLQTGVFIQPDIQLSFTEKAT